MNSNIVNKSGNSIKNTGASGFFRNQFTPGSRDKIHNAVRRNDEYKTLKAYYEVYSAKIREEEVELENGEARKDKIIEIVFCHRNKRMYKIITFNTGLEGYVKEIDIKRLNTAAENSENKEQAAQLIVNVCKSESLAKAEKALAEETKEDAIISEDKVTTKTKLNFQQKQEQLDLKAKKDSIIRSFGTYAVEIYESEKFSKQGPKEEGPALQRYMDYAACVGEYFEIKANKTSTENDLYEYFVQECSTNKLGNLEGKQFFAKYGIVELIILEGDKTGWVYYSSTKDARENINPIFYEKPYNLFQLQQKTFLDIVKTFCYPPKPLHAKPENEAQQKINEEIILEDEKFNLINITNEVQGYFKGEKNNYLELYGKKLQYTYAFDREGRVRIAQELIVDENGNPDKTKGKIFIFDNQGKANEATEKQKAIILEKSASGVWFYTKI